ELLKSGTAKIWPALLSTLRRAVTLLSDRLALRCQQQRSEIMKKFFGFVNSVSIYFQNLAAPPTCFRRLAPSTSLPLACYPNILVVHLCFARSGLTLMFR
ncbi:hypothetical protein, partial [Bordetella trematum]|uniref:hypothetical protein n=1 Tax=Bordetella trematum TaxID=123899 RepID=UPI001EE63A75